MKGREKSSNSFKTVKSKHKNRPHKSKGLAQFKIAKNTAENPKVY
jgi:hypothetical protein